MPHHPRTTEARPTSMALSRRQQRDDSWFSGGFPKLGITTKQFFFLYNRWDEAKGLFPSQVISFLELSRMAPAFWLASLSRREAIDLIGRLKKEDLRPISSDLEESLRHFQSDRMEEVGLVSVSCPKCRVAWPDNLRLGQIGEDVCLICPSCSHVLSLGIGAN